jgi:hypothetical protein
MDMNVKKPANRSDTRSMTERSRVRLEKALQMPNVPDPIKKELEKFWDQSVDGTLSISNYKKAMMILQSFVPEDAMYKKGWSSLKDKAPIQDQLQALIQRKDVPEKDKKTAQEYLSGIVDGKIRTTHYTEARQLVKTYAYSKVNRKKRGAALTSFEDSIFFALDACENVGEKNFDHIPSASRRTLVNQLGNAAKILLEVQVNLMAEEFTDAQDSNQDND